MKRNENSANNDVIANKRIKSVNFSENSTIKKYDGEHKDFKTSKNKFEKSRNNTGKFHKFSAKNDKKSSSAPAPLPKPNWREIKEEKKKLKIQRRAKKLSDMFEISIQAKKISESLRRKDCDVEERKKLTVELHKLLSGNYKRFVFTHDISRVIQWLIRFCTPEMRQSIVRELKPHLADMFQSKYAKHCIKLLLEFGRKEIKQEVVAACNGNVVKLLSHNVASPIIDKIYKTYTSERMKHHFKQEFFGDMYKHNKDDKIKSLSNVFEQSPDMKSATLSAIKINLIKVLNKNLISSALVQSVLAEYLAVCPGEDRSELIVMLRNSFVELSQTKDGSKVAMICVWHGTAKDRKHCLKSIKDNVAKLATSEHGYMILLAMFDSIDDTVLVKKILIPEFLEHIQEIILSEHGRKVVLYLVARRDTHYFHPKLIEKLHQGDGNTTSKKDATLRAQELLNSVISALLDSISSEPANWLANSANAMVTFAILRAGDGEKKYAAFDTIATLLINPSTIIKDEETEYQAVEHPGIHMMLKKLIIADKTLIEMNEKTFGEILINKLDNSTIQHWFEFNRACFLIVHLLENQQNLIVNMLRSKLSCSSQLLKDKKSAGATLLLQKI